MIVADAFLYDRPYPKLYKEETWGKIKKLKTPINLKDIKSESFLVDPATDLNHWQMFCYDVYFHFLHFNESEFSKVTYQTLRLVTDKSANIDHLNYKGEISSYTEKELFEDDFLRHKLTRILPEGDAIEEVDYEVENADELELPYAGFIYYFNPKDICGGTLEIRNELGEVERIKSNPHRLVFFDPKLRHSVTNTTMKNKNDSHEIRVLYSYLYAK